MTFILLQFRAFFIYCCCSTFFFSSSLFSTCFLFFYFDFSHRMALFWRRLSPFQWWCSPDLVSLCVTCQNTWNGVAIYLSCVMVSKDLLVLFMVVIGKLWTVMHCIATTGTEIVRRMTNNSVFFGNFLFFFLSIYCCTCWSVIFQISTTVFDGNFDARWPILELFKRTFHYSCSVTFGRIFPSSMESGRGSINSIHA